jgi:hypothetical protein
MIKIAVRMAIGCIAIGIYALLGYLFMQLFPKPSRDESVVYEIFMGALIMPVAAMGIGLICRFLYVIGCCFTGDEF